MQRYEKINQSALFRGFEVVLWVITNTDRSFNRSSNTSIRFRVVKRSTFMDLCIWREALRILFVVTKGKCIYSNVKQQKVGSGLIRSSDCNNGTEQEQ